MHVTEPVRVERSFTQKLRGKPRNIFPLLCPVREREWAEGWDPLTVYTRSGFAEDNCVFTTGVGSPESIWVITNFDPKSLKMEIVKVTPGITVARITISLFENETGNTDARVTYLYTAIGPEGEKFVREYTEEFFKMFMQYTETALNQFLAKKPENGDGL